MEKDYSNLHKRVGHQIFWQVIKKFKISFFVIIITSIITSGLDIYIPFQFLKLWNVLSTNNFDFVIQAQKIIILIFLLILTRWSLRRTIGFFNSYFQSSVMAGLREQAFSYMIGRSHSFLQIILVDLLLKKINKYARAFEKLMDRLVNDGLPLIIKSVGTIIAIYTLIP